MSQGTALVEPRSELLLIFVADSLFAAAAAQGLKPKGVKRQ